MSNLNLNILVQSIENLSQQVAKSQTVTQQDKVSLTKAQALLDGLKSMFNIEAITMEITGDMITIITKIHIAKVEFVLDPSMQLKLCDVKITDQSGNKLEAEDILQGSVVLEQPNDIRQAMFLVSERLSTLSQ